MDKKGLIGMIVVMVVLLVVGFFWFVGAPNGHDPAGPKQGFKEEKEVKCVPASCCHAMECVLESEAPNCSEIFCTMVCSGPLDCGAGHCEYIDGECEVVPNG